MGNALLNILKRAKELHVSENYKRSELKKQKRNKRKIKEELAKVFCP
jgi:hypothetical protein